MNDLLKKLEILGEAARYDASCASSGSGRKSTEGGIGNGHMSGICHSWTEDGRCVSLLKVLQSNACIYNCAYCANRCSSDIPRATFSPEELSALTVEFYRRNYIEGLFLSSGVVGNPHYTMELMLRTVELLRKEHRFGGYIHVKVIPGADPLLVQKLGLSADRVSVNIELPTSDSLRLLAPDKKPENIFKPMNEIMRLREQSLALLHTSKNAPVFAPAGQATQMIVGATADCDRQILRMSDCMYRRYHMKRVYFSAYIPVGSSPLLPDRETAKAPLLREHRLYQADFLMRFYKFDVEEIVEDELQNLDEDVDPKCAWALRHPERFPVEINTADRDTLLRVPGIGVKSADRIIAARRNRKLELTDLRRLGVVYKRAQYFVICKGRYGGRIQPGSPFLRNYLSESGEGSQLTLWYDAVGTEQPRLQPAAIVPALPGK